jgi:hypothetical protein
METDSIVLRRKGIYGRSSSVINAEDWERIASQHGCPKEPFQKSLFSACCGALSPPSAAFAFLHHSFSQTVKEPPIGQSYNITHRTSFSFSFSFFFFFFCGTGVWTQGLTLLARCSTTWDTAKPFFVLSIFKVGVHKLFGPGWLPATILLISASWIARTGEISSLRGWITKR